MPPESSLEVCIKFHEITPTRNQLELLLTSLIMSNSKKNEDSGKVMIQMTMEELDARIAMALAKRDRPKGVTTVTTVLSDDSSTQDDSEIEWETPFVESTYTLLYMCSYTSQGFWFGIFTTIIERLTMTLTLWNVMDLSDTNNPLQLPAEVDMVVTIAQALAIFLAVGYQSDLIQAGIKIQNGYYPEILEVHKGADYSSWVLSCWAQLFSGFLLLATIFVLTMQAKDVASIMLNFAALHFMADIDDTAFRLAKQGFVTNAVQKDACSVVDIKVPKKHRQNIYRRVLYFVTLGGLFLLYGYLKQKQLNGDYFPTPVEEPTPTGMRAILARIFRRR